MICKQFLKILIMDAEKPFFTFLRIKKKYGLTRAEGTFISKF